MMVTSYVQGHDAATLQSHQSRSAAKQAGYMIHLMRPDSRILDVGCGPGTITCDFATLASQGSVIGVDYTEEVLSIARNEAVSRGVTNILFQVANALELPFPDESFDIVHCHALLVHIPNAVRVVAEMRRVCKKGGHVAAREPDWETLVIHPFDAHLIRWKEVHMELKQKEGIEPNAGRHLAEWAASVGFDPNAIQITCNVLQYSSQDERKWWGDLAAVRVRREVGTRATQSGILSNEDIDKLAEAYSRWGRSETGIWAMMHMMLLCQKN